MAKFLSAFLSRPPALSESKWEFSAGGDESTSTTTATETGEFNGPSMASTDAIMATRAINKTAADLPSTLAGSASTPSDSQLVAGMPRANQLEQSDDSMQADFRVLKYGKPKPVHICLRVCHLEDHNCAQSNNANANLDRKQFSGFIRIFNGNTEILRTKDVVPQYYDAAATETEHGSTLSNSFSLTHSQSSAFAAHPYPDVPTPRKDSTTFAFEEDLGFREKLAADSRDSFPSGDSCPSSSMLRGRLVWDWSDTIMMVEVDPLELDSSYLVVELWRIGIVRNNIIGKVRIQLHGEWNTDFDSFKHQKKARNLDRMGTLRRFTPISIRYDDSILSHSAQICTELWYSSRPTIDKSVRHSNLPLPRRVRLIEAFPNTWLPYVHCLYNIRQATDRPKGYDHVNAVSQQVSGPACRLPLSLAADEWIYEVVDCSRRRSIFIKSGKKIKKLKSDCEVDSHPSDVCHAVQGTLVVTSKRLIFVPLKSGWPDSSVLSLPILGIASVHLGDVGSSEYTMNTSTSTLTIRGKIPCSYVFDAGHEKIISEEKCEARSYMGMKEGFESEKGNCTIDEHFKSIDDFLSIIKTTDAEKSWLLENLKCGSENLLSTPSSGAVFSPFFSCVSKSRTPLEVFRQLPQLIEWLSVENSQRHYAKASNGMGMKGDFLCGDLLMAKQVGYETDSLLKCDLERQGLGKSSKWNIRNSVNANYSLCESYPALICVPASVSDEQLMLARNHRSRGRLPVLCWRHPKNGVPLCRSSQPMSGLSGLTGVSMSSMTATMTRKIFGTSNRENIDSEDDLLLEAIRKTVDFCQGNITRKATGDRIEKKSLQKPNTFQPDHIDDIFQDRKKLNALSPESNCVLGSERSSAIEIKKGKGNVKKTSDSVKSSFEVSPTFGISPTSWQDITSMQSLQRNISSSLESISKHSIESSFFLMPSTKKLQQIENAKQDSSDQAVEKEDRNLKIIEDDSTKTNELDSRSEITYSRCCSLFIMDARPYLSSVANAFMGKGVEDTTGRSWVMHFANIENIHRVRSSYISLGDVCSGFSADFVANEIIDELEQMDCPKDAGISWQGGYQEGQHHRSDLLNGDKTSRRYSDNCYGRNTMEENMQEGSQSDSLLRGHNKHTEYNISADVAKLCGEVRRDHFSQERIDPSNKSPCIISYPSVRHEFRLAFEGTQWLNHISRLLSASMTLVDKLDKANLPVLVHCSDGWDRTAQLTSLTQLMLDPFYRTMTGFITLIEKEWIAFGHKFDERNGFGAGAGTRICRKQSIPRKSLSESQCDVSAATCDGSPDVKYRKCHDSSSNKDFKTATRQFGGDGIVSSSDSSTIGWEGSRARKIADEASPIFLQFLDCVWQLTVQFPKSFQFNERFLIELAHFSFADWFCNFQFNSQFERANRKQQISFSHCTKGQQLNSEEKGPFKSWNNLTSINCQDDESEPSNCLLSLWSDCMLHHQHELYTNNSYEISSKELQETTPHSELQQFEEHTTEELRPLCNVENLRVWRGLYVDRYYETVIAIAQKRGVSGKVRQNLFGGDA